MPSECVRAVYYYLCLRAGRRSVSGFNLRFEAVPLDQEATEGAQVTFTCQGNMSFDSDSRFFNNNES